MFKTIKSVMDTGITVKNSISTVLHPLDAVKTSVQAVMLKQFIALVSKTFTQELADKLKKSASQDMSWSTSLKIPEFLNGSSTVQESIPVIASVFKEALGAYLGIVGLDLKTFDLNISEADRLVYLDCKVGVSNNLKEKSGVAK